MPKKKVKKSAPRTSTKSKSHGQLFDSHPNLKWLLPVFFVIAVVALYAMKNGATMTTDSGGQESYQVPQSTTTTSPTELESVTQ